MDTKKCVAHANKVKSVQTAVNDFYRSQTKVRIYHGSTTSTRSPKLDMTKVVDISNLNEVLHIDTAGKWAEVEPNVSIDKLVKATLVYGLVPAVVPELPAITVGGAVQGGAGESTSLNSAAFTRHVPNMNLS